MEIFAAGQTNGLIKKQDIGKIKGNEPLAQKKLRLKQATKDFESYFLLHMLKAMRETIPESDLLKGGLGKDVYTDMLDEEMSKKLAGNSAGSLSEMLFKSLEKHLEATHATETGEIGKTKINTNLDSARRIPAATKISRNPVTVEPSKAEKVVNGLPSAISTGTRPEIQTDPILSKYGKIIEKASKKHGVNSQLIYSVIKAESSGRADAVSSKGAKGLMQLMDTTAAEMGVSDSLDVRQNIEGGTKYLRKMLDTFDGDVQKALAAYNSGPGTVSKYNGVPPYPETRQYVDKIMRSLPHLKKY